MSDEKQIEHLLHRLTGAQKKPGKQEAVNRLILNADVISGIISDLAEALGILITDAHTLQLGSVQFALLRLKE